MDTKYLLYLSFLLLFGCIKSKERKPAVLVNEHPIYVEQVDSSIVQYLSDQMDAIYMARKIASDKLVDNYLLDIEASKLNLSRDAYLNRFFANIPDHFKKEYYERVGQDTLVHSIINGQYRSISRRSVEGQEYSYESFKNSMRKALLDSLRKESRIVVCLTPPLKQSINLSNALTLFDGSKTSENVLTIISDYECSSCRGHYSFLKKICDKYGNRLRIEKIFFSDAVHLSGISAIAAYNQNKLSEYENILYTSKYDSYDTIFFVNAAVSLGLDSIKFKSDLRNSGVRNKLDRSISYLSSKGIRNTPTLLINRQLISNFSTDDQIEQIIDKELNEESN